MIAPAPRYAELDVTTNFTFLRGGSHAEGWWRRQARPRGNRGHGRKIRSPAWCAPARRRKRHPFVVGTRLVLQTPRPISPIPRPAPPMAGSACWAGTAPRGKGGCVLFLDDVAEHADRMIFSSRFRTIMIRIHSILRNNFCLKQILAPALPRRAPTYRGDDRARIEGLARIAGARASRSSPPARCCITAQCAALFRTCSPASARNARLPTQGFASKPMPSGI